MSLKNITKRELIETGFSGGQYKGFDVMVSLERGGYQFIIGLMLEDNSDACHWICERQSATTLAELVSEAKDIIDNFELTAKQLLDLDQFVEISNHFKEGEEPLPVDEIVENYLNEQKRVQVRAFEKPVYKALVSSYRLAKNLVQYAMEHDPENEQEYIKRLNYIDEQFMANDLIPKGIDKYATDSGRTWVIDRAVNKMALSPEKADLLLSELWLLSRNLEHHDNVIFFADYARDSKHRKNTQYYRQILAARKVAL